MTRGTITQESVQGASALKGTFLWVGREEKTNPNNLVTLTLLQRNVTAYLTDWKASKHRKPLILRGARQVGKTTLVNEFAKTYDFFISLNLEKAADKAFFKAYDDVNTIA